MSKMTKTMKEILIKNYLTTRPLLEMACKKLGESDKGSREELIKRIKSRKYVEIVNIINAL
jgi:hypothetical protein